MAPASSLVVLVASPAESVTSATSPALPTVAASMADSSSAVASLTSGKVASAEPSSADLASAAVPPNTAHSSELDSQLQSECLEYIPSSGCG